MKLHEYLNGMNEEKTMRTLMCMSRQAQNAVVLDGSLSLNDILSEGSYAMIVFKVNGEFMWFTDDLGDIFCNSPFIDGDYGILDPDETYFLRFADYGKTWAALSHDEAVEQAGWPKAHALFNKLTDLSERI